VLVLISTTLLGCATKYTPPKEKQTANSQKVTRGKEISKYYMALEPEKGFITRPLKRIE
jgi:hypothetical protein